MFAIDCLKSNGTHLGTCIDRFYFGSCCQLKVRHSAALPVTTFIYPHRQQRRSEESCTVTVHNLIIIIIRATGESGETPPPLKYFWSYATTN